MKNQSGTLYSEILFQGAGLQTHTRRREFNTFIGTMMHTGDG